MKLTARACPAIVAAFMLCHLARAGHASDAVRVEPEVWNYGVRPRRHLVTTTIRFRPPEGARVRIGLVQINCSCLAAKVTRQAGTHDAPSELRLTMDTEAFDGATKHYAFVSLTEPEERLIRVEVTGWVRPGPSEGKVEVFFARDEAAGEKFTEWWRVNAPRAASAAKTARVKLLPIETLSNYKRMRELERRAKLGGQAPDIIAFVDGIIALAGEAEVRSGLAGFLNFNRNGRPGSLHPKGDAPKTDGTPAPPVHDADAPSPAGAKRLEVELYYFSDCGHCREALALVRKVAGARGGSVRLTVLDTARTPDIVPRFFALAKEYPGAPLILPAMVALVGDEMILGEETILRDIEAVIERQLSRGGASLSVQRPARPASPEDIEEIKEALRAVTIVPIILAGLADGVNPCAFAAMVLLVSVLSASAMSAGAASARRQLVLGGGSFVVAIFMTYFLAGLALFRGARAIESMALVEAIVFWSVWALAVAGAVLSGVDAVAYFRSGDASRMRLKVPDALRRRFAGIIRARFRGFGLVLGGLIGGVMIAVLEGVCTGQMLLPATRYMASTPGLRARGVSLLLLYNALFILPLVAILVAAIAGVHFRKLNAFLRRHLGAAKVLLAIVFGALAAAMLYQRLAGPSLG
jgi:cytochrome c biogenesis protein CcdA/acylphosphatase